MAGPTFTSSPSGVRRTAPRRRTARKGGSGARRRPAGAGNKRRKKAGPKRNWDARRLLPAVVLVLAVVLALVWDGEREEATATTGQCTIAGTSFTLTAEQVGNARIIADVGRQRGLPERAVVIALATAQQESRLRNLDYGDRDSLGLFQQRPSSGWGTDAQVQDPVYAAGKFYDSLVEVPGWETGRLTEVAQRVQRSGFPEAYQQWSELAERLAAAQISELPDQIVCAPDEAAAG